jgi:hypothetical protein
MQPISAETGGFRCLSCDFEKIWESARKLVNLKRYIEARPDLWYTVINQQPITADWVEAALAGLEFCD